MQWENLPFPRAGTYFNGLTTNATDGANLEGKTYLVNDTNVSGGIILLRCVRNVSAIALESRRLVTYKAGKELLQVDGYARLPGVWSKPVDDAYGSLTIPNNDLFYIVEEGPALVLTGLAGDATNDFETVGQFVMSLTAATSQATTAGRIGAGTFAITGNTGVQLALDIFGQLGRALTARTTANTNTATLVYIKRW